MSTKAPFFKEPYSVVIAVNFQSQFATPLKSSCDIPISFYMRTLARLKRAVSFILLILISHVSIVTYGGNPCSLPGAGLSASETSGATQQIFDAGNNVCDATLDEGLWVQTGTFYYMYNGSCYSVTNKGTSSAFWMPNPLYNGKNSSANFQDFATKNYNGASNPNIVVTPQTFSSTCTNVCVPSLAGPNPGAAVSVYNSTYAGPGTLSKMPSLTAANLCSHPGDTLNVISSVPSGATSGGWSWSCTDPGLPPLPTATCYANLAVDGKCGAANGNNSLASVPTGSDLCAVGAPSPASPTPDGSGNLSWSCSGVNGGVASNAGGQPSCAATLASQGTPDCTAAQKAAGYQLYWNAMPVPNDPGWNAVVANLNAKYQAYSPAPPHKRAVLHNISGMTDVYCGYGFCSLADLNFNQSCSTSTPNHTMQIIYGPDPNFLPVTAAQAVAIPMSCSCNQTFGIPNISSGGMGLGF
jgi:hypothetical protein